MCFCYTRPPAKLLRRYACKVIELVTYYFVWYKYKARLRIDQIVNTHQGQDSALRPPATSSVFTLRTSSSYVRRLRFFFYFILFYLFYFIILFFFHWWLILIIFIHYCCLITRYGFSCTFFAVSGRPGEDPI